MKKFYRTFNIFSLKYLTRFFSTVQFQNLNDEKEKKIWIIILDNSARLHIFNAIFPVVCHPKNSEIVDWFGLGVICVVLANRNTRSSRHLPPGDAAV